MLIGHGLFRSIIFRTLVFVSVIWNGHFANAQHNEIYAIEAESALKQKDTARAMAYFESILTNDQQYFPAALRLSELYFERKSWPKAALYANIALDILTDKEKKLTFTDYTANNDDTVAALHKYHNYQKLKADIASVLHLRAKVRMRQENYYSAIADLDTAFGYAPFNADIQVDYGVSLLKMGDIHEALDRFFLAVDIEPENYKAYYNAGLLYLDQRDTAKALDHFEKSIKINDTLAMALKDMAGIYMDREHYEKAIEIYGRALRVDGGSVEALFRRGYAFSKTNQFHKAIEDWDRVYRLDSSQVEAVRNAGLTRMLLEDYDGAIKDFTIYINRLIGDPTGYLNRGYAHYLNRDYNKAIDDFERMTALVPQDGSGYYYQALVYASRKQKKQACRFFKDAVERGYDVKNADAILLEMCR